MSRSIRTQPVASASHFRRRLLPADFRIVGLAAAVVVGSLLAPLAGLAQTSAALTTTDLGDAWLVQGAGANVVAVAGSDGALMIDGGLAANADAVLQAVRAATGNDRIDTLVNTHWHAEATGANEAVGSAGGVIFAHEKTAMFLANRIYSPEFENAREPLPETARPSETTRADGTLDFSGMRIDYGYLPAAHTDGDLYLHFPEQNLLVTGGVVAAGHWPLIDYRSGAWYGGRVRALQWLAELVDEETIVVPSDGAPMTGADILRLRDIYLELFETMIDYMNRGYGPEDAVAANPLQQYEDEFGDASEFLNGAYRSMLIAYVPD